METYKVIDVVACAGDCRLEIPVGPGSKVVRRPGSGAELMKRFSLPHVHHLLAFFTALMGTRSICKRRCNSLQGRDPHPPSAHDLSTGAEVIAGRKSENNCFPRLGPCPQCSMRAAIVSENVHANRTLGDGRHGSHGVITRRSWFSFILTLRRTRRVNLFC
jgi:hypothetical protein